MRRVVRQWGLHRASAQTPALPDHLTRGGRMFPYGVFKTYESSPVQGQTEAPWEPAVPLRRAPPHPITVADMHVGTASRPGLESSVPGLPRQPHFATKERSGPSVRCSWVRRRSFRGADSDPRDPTRLGVKPARSSLRPCRPGCLPTAPLAWSPPFLSNSLISP